MIDLLQWRVSIGVWNCHNCSSLCNLGISLTRKWMLEKLTTLISTVLFLILLILSGDVELNPGPRAEDQSLERPQPKRIRSASCFCLVCDGRIRDHRTIKRHTAVFSSINDIDSPLSNSSTNPPSNSFS